MNSTALHCMDINYSVFTKPNRNKSILLKNLKGKQINRKTVIMVLRKQNLHAVMFKPSTYCRNHKNIHYTINLLTQAQETHFSNKLSVLRFLICWYPALKSSVILNRYDGILQNFQKTTGLCSISNASCLYSSQCLLSQAIMLWGQVKHTAMQKNFWTQRER